MTTAMRQYPLVVTGQTVGRSVGRRRRGGGDPAGPFRGVGLSADVADDGWVLRREGGKDGGKEGGGRGKLMAGITLPEGGGSGGGGEHNYSLFFRLHL